jgi:hypothetical protein
MAHDAFDQLRAANPLPKDPVPPPMAPLLGRAGEGPSHGAEVRSSGATSVRGMASRVDRESGGEDDGESDSH